MVRLQDGVTIVGQGAIADRSREWLGAIDAGVVLLRRLWRRELSRSASDARAREFLRPALLR
jgi:5,5'-dehydrodivanillate O-demethylase